MRTSPMPMSKTFLLTSPLCSDVVANVLSENDCSANNKVLGLKAEVNLLGVELAKVCACVEVGADHTQACPSCPVRLPIRSRSIATG